MPDEVAVEVDQSAPPEDYKEYLAWQSKQPASQPVAPEEIASAADAQPEPQSESSEAEQAEEGQTAVESETTGEVEQDQEQEQQEDEPQQKENRLARRMRKLNGTIASLEARLAAFEEGEAEGDGTEEVASSTETATDAEPPKRPMLRDFEDTADGTTAWDQYEAALDAFNKAQTQEQINEALTKQKQELDTLHGQQMAQADWNKAASRYPDFNEVVARDEVKISAAMEAVMRMDPDTGTSVAYYLGQHPEESERIAKATLASSEKEFGIALARAGMELGVIKAKLPAPGKTAQPARTEPPKPAAAAAAPAAPAPKPQTPAKKVSTASKPPSTLRGVAVPKPDPMDDATASDYKKWNAAREAQLRNRK